MGGQRDKWVTAVGVLAMRGIGRGFGVATKWVVAFCTFNPKDERGPRWVTEICWLEIIGSDLLAAWHERGVA